MQAGRLDRRIQLQSYTTTQDGYGQPVETWSTYATVWATVRDQSGREFLESAQIDGQTATMFTIRYRSDVAYQHRILYGSDYYDIRSIQYPEDRKRYVTIMAVRGTNDG